MKYTKYLLHNMRYNKKRIHRRMENANDQLINYPHAEVKIIKPYEQWRH